MYYCEQFQIPSGWWTPNYAAAVPTFGEISPKENHFELICACDLHLITVAHYVQELWDIAFVFKNVKQNGREEVFRNWAKYKLF